MSLCIIPARGGSTRVPFKNGRRFLGKPMLSYAIRAAKESDCFDRIIVSTDDERIAAIAKHYGAIVHNRAPKLCDNEVGTQEVMAHVLREIKVPDNELVCCLYPCVPLLEPNWFHVAIGMYQLRPCSYVVAVADNPLRDIGNFYVGGAGAFIREQPLYNTHTGLFVVPPERAIDINTEDDWQLAEKMFLALAMPLGVA